MYKRQGIAVCAATEHHAILHPVEFRSGRVAQVTDDGAVDLDHLETLLDDNVAVISVMLVNNESGRVVDLNPIADLRDRVAPGAMLHTDAVQGINWVDIREALRRVDMVSLSGHKFGAPKGVGALAIRPGLKLAPQLLGGGQESERRSGTHNTAGIVAFGAALECLAASRLSDIERLGRLSEQLSEGLISRIDGCSETISRGQRVSGILQLVIQGIESEALLVLLERQGVMASAAASCASGAMDPSHVLAAMGFDRKTAAGSLRLSLGWCTEEWEIERALSVIPECVDAMRGAP